MTAEKSSIRPALFIPPLWGAGAFTICSTIYTLSLPGRWYWPVIHEAMSFLLSILPFFALNFLFFVPIGWAITRFTRHFISGIVYVVLIAIATTLIAYQWEWLGHKPTILHPAILFGAFIPALVMAIATWTGVVTLDYGE